MTKQDFLKQFDELIEVEPGSTSGSQVLAEMDAWDSLAVMGFLAMADEQFGVALAPQKVAEAKSVDDLFSLVEQCI